MLGDLLWIDPATREHRPLNLEQKRKIAEELDKKREVDWKIIKQLILGRKLKRDEDITINFEASQKDKVKGNSTAAKIHARIPDLWDSLNDEQQERMVEIMITMRDKGGVYKGLKKAFDLEPEVAYRLATIELEPGTCSLSTKAMRIMLDWMKEGLTKTEAQDKAGYPRRDQIDIPQQDILPHPPQRLQIPNPRVRKALGQVRKVVNALVREHGRFDAIRIEMARDMKLNKKEKEAAEKQNRLNRQANLRADELWKQLKNEEPSRKDRIKVRLWEEAQKTCPYCGKTIGCHDLSSDTVDIEHIVPYSLSLDDSFSNLTLSCRDCNSKKGNRLPSEVWFGDDLEAILRRVDEWNGAGTRRKKHLFTLKKQDVDLDKFLSRQLNETKTICRFACQYLAPVANEVTTTKGEATSMLAKRYGLYRLIDEDGDKVRSDLRHHALDAIAVALTTRSLFMKLSKISSERRGASPLMDRHIVPDAPSWLFAALRGLMDSMIVSHEPTRGIDGSMHMETAFKRRSEGIYQVRKPLWELSPKEVSELIDRGLSRRLMEHLKQSGEEPKVAFKNGFQLPNGKKVIRASTRKPFSRMFEIKSKQGVLLKSFQPGEIHHVEIFGDKAPKEVRFVNISDAALRARQARLPIIDQTHPRLPFYMCLCKNDMVLNRENGIIYHVEGFESDGRISLRRHESGSTERDESLIRRSILSLQLTKLEIDPLGRVREVRE
jgi:CRISPR-associated endonuclease Csn1